MKTSFWSGAGRLWCTVMHRKAMWPLRGSYRCSTCLRSYPVRWADDEGFPAARSHGLPAVDGAGSQSSSFALASAALGGRKVKLAETPQPWA